MIKGMRTRINVDQRGHITCGMLVSEGGKERPKGLDHFNISAFPELMAVYGDKPAELVIFLPSNRLEDVFDCEYNAWGKGGVKKRFCDGEECVHRVKENVGGRSYGNGEVGPCVCAMLPEDDRDRCRYSCHLKVFIGHPETRKLISPVCYVLRSHSVNSGTAVYSELVKILGLTQSLFGTPRLFGMPFMLGVAMVTRRDDAGRAFPIWRIQAMTFTSPQLMGGESDEDMPSDLLALPAYVGPTDEGELAGEIADALVEGKNAKLGELDRFGAELYGENWPQSRGALARWISKGAADTPEQLHESELDSLVVKIHKKLGK